jgi:hypothetical protein
MGVDTSTSFTPVESEEELEVHGWGNWGDNGSERSCRKDNARIQLYMKAFVSP